MTMIPKHGRMTGGGLTRGQELLDEMKLAVFYHYKPNPTWTNLDVACDVMQPVVCKTLDDLVRLPIQQHRLPVSFLRYASKDKQKRRLPPPNGDRFFKTSFRYLGPTVSQLLELHRRLIPEHRNLCLLVQGKCPVHFYVDLDEEAFPPRDPVKVRAAFRRLTSECFRRDYAGREFDWSDEQWYEAHGRDKYSDHAHVRSQAWKTVGMLGGWILGSLVPFIETKAHKNDPDALCLGTMTYLPNHSRGTWKCIVDQTVYNDLRNFRLCGHRKPGGRPLIPVRVPGEDKQSEDEYLFRSLPTYAITAPKDRWCEWKDRNADGADTPSKASRSGGGGGSSSSNNTAGGGGLGAARGAGAPASFNDYRWMSQARIPWFDDRGWEQPKVVATGFFKQNSDGPFVRYDHGTPCTHCSTMKDKRVCHEENWSYLTLSDCGGELHFRSFRGECKQLGERFPFPLEAYGTLGALPKHMRDLVLYLRSLPADGPQWTPKPLAPVRLVRPTATPSQSSTSSNTSTNGMVLPPQHEQKHDRPTPMVLDTDDDGPSPDAAGFSMGANVDEDDDTHMADDEDEEANRRRPVRPVDMMQDWIKRHKSGGCSSSRSTSSNPVSPDG